MFASGEDEDTLRKQYGHNSLPTSARRRSVGRWDCSSLQEDAARLCARRLNTKTQGHTNGLAGIVLPLYSASASDPSR